MSVFEYVAKFKEFCKFSTIYQCNPDENWKYIKFDGGLRKDILASIEPMEIQNYTTLVNKSRLWRTVIESVLWPSLMLLRRGRHLKNGDSSTPYH